MTKPDLRALCARMADELDHYRQVLMGDRRETHALAAEARAALEATADCNYPSCVDDSPDERCSRWLVGDCPGPCNPDRARTALAQPEPQGPTDEELRAFYDSEDNDEYEWPWWHRIFRILLTRYARPAIEPVPVSERLPGPEDCDAEGHCWLFRVALDGVGDWHQKKPHPSAESSQFFRETHWLPHWVLPVPGVEGKP
jgi:hypothetical protein